MTRNKGHVNHRRWAGWRTNADAPAEIKGDQPTKKPGTRKKKKDRPRPWYWVRNRGTSTCGSCGRELRPGLVIAFSRTGDKAKPKVRCESCAKRDGLKVTTSQKLKDERRELVQRQLRKSQER